MNCKLCEKEFGFAGSLHSHLKKVHNTTQAEYYNFFFPRHDKFTGEKIKFKTLLEYFDTDFNSRESLVEWCMSDPAGAEYAVNLLRKRMKDKTLSFCPGHLELKSIMSLSMLGFEKLFGSAAGMLEKSSLPSRFDYSSDLVIHDGDLKIYMDTREQVPLLIEGMEKQKLIVGDYMPNEEFYSDLFIERKSLSDLAGTLTSGFDRFQREVSRAADLGMYLVVLVECSFRETMDYKNTFGTSKMNGKHIFHEIRRILGQNGNIQFVFAGNRKNAARLAQKIFRLKGRAKTADLEFLKDKNII